MSIEDRDWIREPERRGFSFAGFPPILTVVSATAVAFLVQSAVANGSPAGDAWIHEHLALSREGVLRGEAWQPITYLLLHGGLAHLFWNMVGLWAFGTILRDHASDRTLWLTYLAGGIAGAAACVLWDLALPSVAGARVVGASGAVTAILVAAVCRAPRTPIHVFLMPLPVPLWILGALYLALDLIAAVRIWAGGESGGVAVQAHLGGAAAAVALFLLARGRAPAPRRSRREAVGDDERLEPPAPPPEEAPGRRDEARVDALLAKIHAWGMASLTEEEREFLKRASERYRGRGK